LKRATFQPFFPGRPEKVFQQGAEAKFSLRERAGGRKILKIQ
jgi:hypothetical protein